MNDAQEKLAELSIAGWSMAAVADELGVHHNTVLRWRSGTRNPENIRPILIVMDSLLKKRPPKLKRYPGTHATQRRARGEE